MQKIVQIIIVLILVSVAGKAQTNVTGGVYSNTTWSLSASPYIITDTVVVFPGVILNIQPGVTVKFNSKAQIEVRQSAIYAWGTSTDSITFTSNTSLAAGSYSGIYLTGGTMTSKFNYCVFKYANAALTDQRGGSGDTIIVKNSTFSYNNTGLFGQGTSYGIIDSTNFVHNVNFGVQNNFGGHLTFCNMSHNSTGFHCDGGNTLNNCTINYNSVGMDNMSGSLVNNSTVSYNQTGIRVANLSVSIKNSTLNSNSLVAVQFNGSGGDTLYNCQLLNNGTGLNDNIGSGSYPCYIVKNGIVNNTTGIILKGTLNYISCNKICNNSMYDLQYTGVNNVNVTGNYWCTADSASTEAVIYDGYDNISYGLTFYAY